MEGRVGGDHRPLEGSRPGEVGHGACEGRDWDAVDERHLVLGQGSRVERHQTPAASVGRSEPGDLDPFGVPVAHRQPVEEGGGGVADDRVGVEEGQGGADERPMPVGLAELARVTVDAAAHLHPLAGAPGVSDLPGREAQRLPLLGGLEVGHGLTSARISGFWPNDLLRLWTTIGLGA